MDLGLTNKIALVAASSKGLGRGCATALAAEGAHVTICARDESILKTTRDEIAAATGANILAVAADMTRPADIEAVVQQTVDHFGGLHILVTNAGGPPAGFLPDFSDEQWQAAFNLTMMSAVRLIRAALPHQKKAGWGRIINITSMTVKEPLDNLVLSNPFGPQYTVWLKQSRAKSGPMALRLTTSCRATFKQTASSNWLRMPLKTSANLPAKSLPTGAPPSP